MTDYLRINVSKLSIPGIWWRAVGAELLYMHSKEAHINAIYFLKRKDCLGYVRKAIGHLWLATVWTGHTELGFHARPHLHHLLRTRQHPDGDLTGTGVLALEEQVDAVLEVCAELCLRQTCIH